MTLKILRLQCCKAQCFILGKDQERFLKEERSRKQRQKILLITEALGI